MSLSPTRRRLSHNIFPRGTIWGNKSEGGILLPLFTAVYTVTHFWSIWRLTSDFSKNRQRLETKNIQAQQPFLSLINWNRGQEVFSPFLRRIFSSRVDWANGGKTKWVLLAQKEGKILVGWRAVKTGDTVSFRTILGRRGERMLRPLKKENGGGKYWCCLTRVKLGNTQRKRREKTVQMCFLLSGNSCAYTLQIVGGERYALFEPLG